MTLPRRCETCVHFENFDGIHGRCGHPNRQPVTDAAITVRCRELACRIAWAVDSWEGRTGEIEARVTNVLVWGPFSDDTPLDDLPGDLLALLMNNMD